MLRRIVPAAVVLVCACAPASQIRGAEPPAIGLSPATERILVLRNGQTLKGRISQAEAVYVLDLPNGQIQIKAADVDLVCGSIEEGYRLKRARIQIGNVHDHLQLAQWCLRQGLLREAGDELSDAAAAEPEHRMIAAMRHRLELAKQPPQSADAIRQPTPGPTTEDLDRMVRGLPRGTVETFTQSVQPVLMNHCATGGCHGPQSETALRLFRVGAGKSASRRATQRNLFALLPFVDRENPAGSKLLTAAEQPHGTVAHAAFSEHQAVQYRRLADWVYQLGDCAVPQAPSTLDAGWPGGAIAAPPQILSPEARFARPLVEPRKSPKVKRGASPEEIDAAIRRATHPFDPEGSNQQASPENNSAANPNPDE